MLRIVTLFLAMLSSTAMPAPADVTRETEGYGATQQEAVANALVEAVRQVRGSAAGVDRGVEETMAVVAGGAVMVTTKPAADVYTVSRGFVRSYQLLDVRPAGNGYQARIRAVVPVFESAVADAGKQRIAVLPFRVSAAGFRLAGHGDAAVFSQRLADRLVTELAQQQGVVVVNRDFFAELGLEKAVLTADAAPEELIRLGAAVGADFLLVGRVQEARSEREAGPYGSQPRETDEIRLSWRMIEAATGKLLRAGDIALDHRRDTGGAYGLDTRDDFEASALYGALARHVADAALERPAAAPAPVAAPAPLRQTPGSSEKPLKW